jgi:hypothetical protein
MVHANVRRLVLASLGDQEPECGICLEKFTHADATVMDCAHVICRRCSERTRDARCPFCRHAKPVTERYVEVEYIHVEPRSTETIEHRCEKKILKVVKEWSVRPITSGWEPYPHRLTEITERYLEILENLIQANNRFVREFNTNDDLTGEEVTNSVCIYTSVKRINW